MGTSRFSSNIKSVFDSIVKQFLLLKKITNEDFEKSEINEVEKRKKLNLNSLNNIYEIKILILSNYLEKNEKIIIFLDSIDQLIQEDHNLNWLFLNLPKNVKIIYSVIKDYNGISDKLYQKLSVKNCLEIRKIDKNKAFDDLLLSHPTEDQKKKLEELFRNINDINLLHLNLIKKIISKWKLTEKTDKDFSECINVEKTIIYLFTLIQESKRYNSVVFKKCLFYLTYFENNGISENEMEGILSLDDVVLNEIFEKHHPPIRTFPLSIWLMIKNELKDYLTNKEVDNTQVVSWYHRKFIEASKTYCEDINEDQLFENIINYYAATYKKKMNGEKNEKKKFRIRESLIKKLERSSNKWLFDKNINRGKDENTYESNIPGDVQNERKINNFLRLFSQIKDEENQTKLLKKHVYNEMENKKSFFLQKLEYDKTKFADTQYQFIKDENENKNLIFTASYFGHKCIVKEIIENITNHDLRVAINTKFGPDKITPNIIASQNGHKDIVELLIENQANVNEKDNDGYTALLIASQNGHKDIVKLLIEKKAYVNEKSEDGCTALYIASLNGHKDIVELLIENHANLNEKDNDGFTALFNASQNGHKDIVELLVNKLANVHEKSKAGFTALYIASQNGHKDIVESLINKQANVKEKYNAGFTALHIASQNGHRDIVELLIENHANVNEKDNDGYTALYTASRNGHKDIVELLIEKQANVNEKSKSGLTSLFGASRMGHKEIVELLIEKQANVIEKSKDGYTALYYASRNGHKDIVALLIENQANVNEKSKDGYTALYISSQNGHKDIVELLLEKQANVNEKSNAGFTALYIASQNCHKDIVELLIEKQANVNEKSNAGFTALYIASQIGHKDIVELLIENQANVKEKNNAGFTALHIASQNGHRDIVELLIENQANVNEKDNDGYTALYIASQNGNKDIVKLLIEKQGNFNQ